MMKIDVGVLWSLAALSLMKSPFCVRRVMMIGFDAPLKIAAQVSQDLM